MTELFTKVPHWLIREYELLNGNELLLYLAMLSRADRKGICYPSVALLAREARMSESTVRRTRNRLVDKGLVTVTRRTIGDSRNDSNLYRVALPKRSLVKFTQETPVDNLTLDEPEQLSNGGHSDWDGVTVTVPPSHSDWGDGVTVTGEEEPLQEDPIKKTLSVEHDAFEFTNLGITEAQWHLLSDLYIHITGNVAEQRTKNEWHQLTSDAAGELITRFYANVKRNDDYTGPEYGTPAYKALSEEGRKWADAGMVPDNRWIGDTA
jgi:hypothetical protein